MGLLRSPLVTASIVLGVLAGCGSSEPTSTGGGEAGKSPAEIMADVKRDLAKVKSYHVVESQKEDGALAEVSGDVMASGAARIAIRQNGSSLQMVVLSKAFYLKADAHYWKRFGGPAGGMLAERFAKRWVGVPASAAAGVTPMLKKLLPKHLASCIALGAGTLTNNGVKTIDGRKAIELEDKGDRPGTIPGLLYVAADGPTLPLREAQTGPRRAGGQRVAGCDDSGHHEITDSKVTISRYDAVDAITAPPGALSLDQAGTAGSVA